MWKLAYNIVTKWVGHIQKAIELSTFLSLEIKEKSYRISFIIFLVERDEILQIRHSFYQA